MRAPLSFFAAALLLLAHGCQSAPREESPVAEPLDVVAEDLLARMANGEAPVILDVRTQQEFDAGHVEGAVLIPYDEIETLHAEQRWSLDQEIVVYCRSGRRAKIAEDFLRGAGYTRIRHLEGDMNSWKAKGLPLVGSS